MLEDRVLGIHYSFLVSPLLEFMPPFKGISILHKIFYYLTRPLANIIIISYILALSLKHGRIILPELGSCNAGLSPPHFWQYLNSGLIEEHQVKIKQFKENGVEFENGKSVEVDLVILGTGFMMDNSIFDQNLKQKLFDKKGLIIYKNILPVNIENLAFVGFAAALGSPSSFDLSAKWAVLYFKQRIKVPPKQEMIECIKKYRDWCDSWQLSKNENYKYYCVAFFEGYYYSDLIRDMGFPFRRKGYWPLLNLIYPTFCQDFSPLNKYFGKK